MGKSNKSGKELVGQMKKYKLYEHPFNMPWSDDQDDMFTWWLTLEAKPNYLEILALKLLRIKPQNASCERVYSILKWLSANRRARLNTSKLEAMAKIHSWYISNAKEELKHISKNFSEEEIKFMIQNINFDDDEFFINEDLCENEEINELIIPESRLEIDEYINLQHELFNESNENSMKDIESETETIGELNFNANDIMEEFDDSFFED